MTPLLTPSHDLSALIQDPPGPPLLLRRMQQLPRRTQQMLLYSRLDALPYPTIAQRMNTSLGQVETTLQTALCACCEPLLPAQIMAIHWYVKLQSPSTTASERIDFRRWLDSASAHLAAITCPCHRTAMAAITCPCHRAGQCPLAPQGKTRPRSTRMDDGCASPGACAGARQPNPLALREQPELSAYQCIEVVVDERQDGIRDGLQLLGQVMIVIDG